jgi:hypothetical protein
VAQALFVCFGLGRFARVFAGWRIGGVFYAVFVNGGAAWAAGFGGGGGGGSSSSGGSRALGASRAGGYAGLAFWFGFWGVDFGDHGVLLAFVAAPAARQSQGSDSVPRE